MQVSRQILPVALIQKPSLICSIRLRSLALIHALLDILHFSPVGASLVVILLFCLLTAITLSYALEREHESAIPA